MPRAHRHYLPGHVWHLTHRCHRRQFLLKFLKDRRLWVRWLYEARRRFDLCVLDYTVTSNHVHLLVRDRGRGEIARSMQLIAGRSGQQFNDRTDRRGAFWEDRYHATAIETGDHLARGAETGTGYFSGCKLLIEQASDPANPACPRFRGQDIKLEGAKQILIYKYQRIAAIPFAPNEGSDTTFIFNDKGILDDIMKSGGSSLPNPLTGK